MSGKEKTQKAIKEEQEAFARLIVERKLAEQLLKEPDQLLSHEWVLKEGFDKLYQAAKKYEAAIQAVMIAAQEDDAVAVRSSCIREESPSR